MAIELRKMDVDDLPVFRECCTHHMSQTGMNIRWTEWRRWKSRTARFAGFTTLLWSAGESPSGFAGTMPERTATSYGRAFRRWAVPTALII